MKKKYKKAIRTNREYLSQLDDTVTFIIYRIAELEKDVRLLKEQQVVAACSSSLGAGVREPRESGVDQDGNGDCVSGPCGC